MVVSDLFLCGQSEAVRHPFVQCPTKKSASDRWALHWPPQLGHCSQSSRISENELCTAELPVPDSVITVFRTYLADKMAA